MKIFILSCTFWTAKIYFKFLLINSDIVQLPVSQSLWLAFCYLLLFLYGPRILCIHDGLLVWKIMDRRDNVFFLWRLFALSPRGSRRADQLYPILDYAALQLVCNHGKSQSTSSLLRLLCCRLVALPLETLVCFLGPLFFHESWTSICIILAPWPSWKFYSFSHTVLVFIASHVHIA